MKDRWIVLGCFLFAIAFFADALIGPRTVVPTGFLYTQEPWKTEHPELAGDPSQQYDLLHQFYPWAQYFRTSVLEEGRFPLWNPYNYLGTPFFANPQTALLFPLTWLHLLLPLSHSFSWIFALKLGLILSGTFLWLRGDGLGRPAALTGAAVFGLSLHTVVSLAFPYSNVTALLPWTLIATRRLARRPATGSLALLAGCLTLVVFAGQPQSALVVFVLVAIAVAAECGGGLRGRLKPFLWIAGSFATAALASAVMWLPAFGFAAETMVPYGPGIVKTAMPYHPGNLVNLAVPDFFGSHLDGSYWGFPGYHDAAFYGSLAALMLVPLALRRLRRRSVVVAAAAALLSIGLLLAWPPFEWLFALPGFDLMRRSRFAVMLAFAVAVLAANGLQQALEMARRKRAWVLLAGLAALTVLILVAFSFFGDYLSHLDPSNAAMRRAWTAGAAALGAAAVLLFVPRRAAWIVLLLIVGELGWRAWPLNPRGSSASLFPPLALSAALQGAPPRVTAMGPLLQPNTGMLYGIQDVRGYDVMTPQRLFRYMRRVDPHLGDALSEMRAEKPGEYSPDTLMLRVVAEGLRRYGEPLRSYMRTESYWSVTVPRTSNPRLFDWLQPQCLLRPRGAKPPDPSWTPTPVGGLGAWRNPRAEKAQLYFEWKGVKGLSAALDALVFEDLRRVAVVESDELPSPPPSGDLQGQWRLVLGEIERRVYQVDCPAACLLVEFERFSPGWWAWVDGGRRRVLPVDALFRGVMLGSGRHEVELRYSPRSFQMGAAMSLIGLGVFAILGVWDFKRRRRAVRS